MYHQFFNKMKNFGIIIFKPFKSFFSVTKTVKPQVKKKEKPITKKYKVPPPIIFTSQEQGRSPRFGAWNSTKIFVKDLPGTALYGMLVIALSALILYIGFNMVVSIGSYVLSPTLIAEINKAYDNAQRGNLGGVTQSGDTVIVLSQEIPQDQRIKILNAIDVSAKKYKVDPNLIQAVIITESNYNQFAVSHKNARGLMQLMPRTAKDLGVTDIHNIEQNIDGGTKYIKQLLQKFKTIDLAIAAYNAGPQAVKRYNGIPPFKETRQYVKKVKRAYYALNQK